MITVSRDEDGNLQVTNGHMRLRAQLQVRGWAEVVELGTGNTLQVHEVGGKIVALSDESMRQIEDAAAAAIRQARNG